MNLLEKLNKIQTEIKVPKTRVNSFGRYNFRNCEDILTAVKPLLKEYKATILINDRIELIGDRFYLKAVATIYDLEDEDKNISVSAYARESLDKKGMDVAQITGTSSSYARKYALNGLLLIDDTKDDDEQKYFCSQCNSEVSRQQAEITYKRWGTIVCSSCINKSNKR